MCCGWIGFMLLVAGCLSLGCVNWIWFWWGLVCHRISGLDVIAGFWFDVVFGCSDVGFGSLCAYLVVYIVVLTLDSDFVVCFDLFV